MVLWDATEEGDDADGDDSANLVREPARIFLWTQYVKDACDDNKKKEPIKALVYPLEVNDGRNGPFDDVMFFAIGGRISKTPEIVNREQIDSVAYVLPSIENRDDEFPETVEEAEYFVALPPRSEWGQI